MARPQPSLAKERVDLSSPAIKDFDPLEVGETVGQFLGFLRLIELSKSIVVLHETQSTLRQLPGQPLMAIDVDLHGEREPALQAEVDQAKLGIEEIVVQHALRA